MNPLTELTRRRFLGNVYTGLSGIGLMQLLSEAAGAEHEQTGWQPGQCLTHHPAKAKRVLQIFCPGPASHMDLWEHKPALEKHHGESLPGEEDLVSFQGKNGKLMKSPWPFAPSGESGKRISTMLPNMARHVDDIAFIHSMHSKTNTHGPGENFMSTGFTLDGFPSIGAWATYALGRENHNMPAFIAIAELDHKRLTFYHNGLERRLTDVHGHVIHNILS